MASVSNGRGHPVSTLKAEPHSIIFLHTPLHYSPSPKTLFPVSAVQILGLKKYQQLSLYSLPTEEGIVQQKGAQIIRAPWFWVVFIPTAPSSVCHRPYNDFRGRILVFPFSRTVTRKLFACVCCCLVVSSFSVSGLTHCLQD